MKKQYCLTFAFDHFDNVALILKKRPEWQAGHWNGIGGKVEPTDFDHIAASQREFEEETGMKIHRESFKPVGEMTSPRWIVYVNAVRQAGIRNCVTMTDEEVAIFEIDNLPMNMISNLDFLIPMCLAKLRDPDHDQGQDDLNSFTINYH